MSDPAPVVAEPAAPASSGLSTVLALLAPGEGRRTEYLAVGPVGRPSFLLPRDRRVAVAACRSYNALRPRSVRRRRTGVAAVLGVGLGPVVAGPVVAEGPVRDPAGRSLLDELAQLLGTGPLHAAVGMGGVDDWWTPVLQLFDGAGRPVGYAKVGTTPLAAELVRNEAIVLRYLRHRPPHRLVVPRVVGHGVWAGCQVVVTEPLPAQVRALGRTMPPRCPLVATGSTASVAPLASSRWWGSVRDELAGPAGATGTRTRAALDALDHRCAGVELPLGLLHGDWVPWNLALLHGSGSPALVAWDWEYGATDAPVGLDDLHGGYVVARQRGADVAGALSVGIVHGREVRPDPPLLDLLALVHPAAVLARELQRARLAPASAGPDGLTPEAAAMLSVLERRLGSGTEVAA